jgi:hypothetical protein
MAAGEPAPPSRSLTGPALSLRAGGVQGSRIKACCGGRNMWNSSWCARKNSRPSNTGTRSPGGSPWGNLANKEKGPRRNGDRLVGSQTSAWFKGHVRRRVCMRKLRVAGANAFQAPIKPNALEL